MELHREQALDNGRIKILLNFFIDTLVGGSTWNTGLKFQVAAEGGVSKLLHLFTGVLDKARKRISNSKGSCGIERKHNQEALSCGNSVLRKFILININIYIFPSLQWRTEIGMRLQLKSKLFNVNRSYLHPPLIVNLGLFPPKETLSVFCNVLLIFLNMWGKSGFNIS